MIETANGNRYEYVLSGVSFTRILFQEALTDPELIQDIADMFDRMNGKGYDFSLLYNAFSEARFGKLLKGTYGNHIKNLYADSGGLQAITLGAKITPEMKRKVYLNQSESASVGMSFDEIPLSMSGDRSKRLDTSGRWFDFNKVDACAKQSGLNLLEQIEFFNNAKCSTRPVLICHGNDYDSFMKWADLVIKEIPKDLHQYIGGVALSSGAHGRGTLEDISRAFYYTQLPLDVTHKHLHLLGVGSLSRMLPTITFVNNGLYKDTHISFDSTTHSSSPHYGRYCTGSTDINITRHLEPGVIKSIYDDASKWFDIHCGHKEFFDGVNMASKKFEAKYGKRHSAIKSMVIWILSGASNFMENVANTNTRAKIAVVAGNRKEEAIFNSLYDVHTLDDFNHWNTHVGKHCSSDRINSSRPNTLSEFFA